jgi:hypothetical protein
LCPYVRVVDIVLVHHPGPCGGVSVIVIVSVSITVIVLALLLGVAILTWLSSPSMEVRFVGTELLPPTSLGRGERNQGGRVDLDVISSFKLPTSTMTC